MQVTGFGALVDGRGVGQKLALAVVQPQLAGVDQGCDLRHGPQPGDLVRVAGEQIVSGRLSGVVSERCREW